VMLHVAHRWVAQYGCHAPSLVEEILLTVSALVDGTHNYLITSLAQDDIYSREGLIPCACRSTLAADRNPSMLLLR
jgi:hypothetical protein